MHAWVAIPSVQICTLGFGFQKCETQVCILPNNARLGSSTNPTVQKCTADFDFRKIFNETNPTVHFRKKMHGWVSRQTQPCTLHPWVQDPRVRLGGLISVIGHLIFSLKGRGQSERKRPSSELPSTYSITQASMLSSQLTPMSETQLG